MTGSAQPVSASGPRRARLEAVSLTYRYPNSDTDALSGCSLAVPAGQRVALLGANGSGKTTLLLLLNGSFRPAAGEVRLDGAPTSYDRAGLRRWRRAVGLVVQDPDDMLLAGTVRQELAFGVLNLGRSEDDARVDVDRILVALSLDHLRDRPTHLLSAGERHRVAIAAMAITEPAVLLLDEPTAGLDPAGVEEVLAVLDRLHAAGTTIVVSTHDVDLAHRWADVVAVMVAGSVAACGSREVLHDQELIESARLRPPSAFTIWQSLPGDLRPATCPPDVATLAVHLRSASPVGGVPVGEVPVGEVSVGEVSR